MNFKYPFFLYFILLSIIPVIIHFINFRKHKKILFSNVKLLQAIKHKKSSYNKLKDIILMLTRMLAVSLLAISFAQPFFEKENVTFPKEWSVFNKIFNKQNISRKECLLLPFKTLAKALDS